MRKQRKKLCSAWSILVSAKAYIRLRFHFKSEASLGSTKTYNYYSVISELMECKWGPKWLTDRQTDWPTDWPWFSPLTLEELKVFCTHTQYGWARGTKLLHFLCVWNLGLKMRPTDRTLGRTHRQTIQECVCAYMYVHIQYMWPGSSFYSQGWPERLESVLLVYLCGYSCGPYSSL